MRRAVSAGLAAGVTVVVVVIGGFAYVYQTGGLSAVGGNASTVRTASNGSILFTVSAFLVTSSDGTARINVLITNTGSAPFALDSISLDSLDISSYSGAVISPGGTKSWGDTFYGGIIQRGEGYPLSVGYEYGDSQFGHIILTVDAA